MSSCPSRLARSAAVRPNLTPMLTSQLGCCTNTLTASACPASAARKSTPLHVAARHNQPDCVKTLINDSKAPVNATDEPGRTALHLAAEAGSAETVNVLVQHPDCRVNATDGGGCTALHHAAWTGRAEAVNVLASHPSCDFSISNDRGDTAADWARHWGHDDIAALIEAKSRGNFSKDYEHLWSKFCSISDVICPFDFFCFAHNYFPLSNCRYSISE